MGRKKNKPARDVISYDGEIPDWAMEEARNHIKQNRDRFQFSSEPTQKYYVVYSLRGPAALNRRCGIYTEWYGIGGAEEQTRGCANKSTTASSFKKAEDLLAQGVALEFRDKHLHRALYQPQSSAPFGNSGPSRRFRGPEDESEDEDTSRKRPRLQEQLGTPESSHASGPRYNTAPDDSNCFVIDLNGEKQQREVIDLTGEEQEPEPPAEPPALEFPLCPEQQRALDLALKGHNLFITGSGGCGKSVLVKALHSNFTARKRIVHLLAPTGQAATNIGGRTTYSYAAWTPESLGETDKTLIKQARLTRTFNRLYQTNVLIIDEISMVERQFFERLSFVLSAIRGDTRPFGGVQIITVGDFCQLGPVKPFKYCYEEKSYIAKDDISIPCGIRKIVNGKYTCGNAGHPTFRDRDKWAFNSLVWQRCNFRYIHLTQIHRQKDEMFVGMLQSIRMGYCNEEDLDVLLRERNVDDGVVLFATKDRVREHNDRELDMLHHRPQVYDCVDSGQSRGDEQRFEDRLVLKETMPVVLLANLDVEKGICNGSQGRIVGFEPLKPEEEPKEPAEKNYKRDKVAYGVAMHKYKQVNLFKKTRNLFPRVEFSNGETRVIRPDCSVFNIETMVMTMDSRSTVVLASCSSRTQIPLAPGWAMTIHKSQSLSLDRLTVDLNNVWDGRQTYVGLSRARTLEGLKVRGSKNQLRTKLRLDPVVGDFMEKVAAKARADASG